MIRAKCHNVSQVSRIINRSHGVRAEKDNLIQAQLPPKPISTTH